MNQHRICGSEASFTEEGDRRFYVAEPTPRGIRTSAWLPSFIGGALFTIVAFGLALALLYFKGHH
jgi:hypothetical protein